jgi:hypothetical protein
MNAFDDKWSPLYQGAISNNGACWVRKNDGYCFSVKEYKDGIYTLTGGNNAVAMVTQEQLGTEFRPT